MSIAVFTLDKGPILQKLSLLPTINSLDDASRLLPQGVYSTFRTISSGKKVLGLKAHLRRLYDPCAQFGITPSVTSEELRSGLKKLLIGYQTTEARVRICVSLSDQVGQMFVMLEPLRLLGEDIYEQGVRVISSSIERPDPRIKSTIFIQKSTQERISLAEKGVFEALMVRGDRILERFTSNFYALKDNRVVTARQGILLGVTRKAILRLSHSSGIPIEYRALRLNELPHVDETFISSSSRGVVPVVKVNELWIGQGRPGPFSLKIRKLYESYIQEKAETI